MNKVGLFGGLLLLLSLLVVPVSAVAFPGCPESAPGTECRVDDDFVGVDSTLNNAVFQYHKFTVDAGSMIFVAPVPEVEHNGGNITIIAKEIEIGGQIFVNGYPGTVGWTLHGGNGGTITLIAKDRLFLGSESTIDVRGANGRVESCSAGNGGNGGRINLRTVSGASVTTLGALNVSGGLGGTVSSSCANVTNGTNGVAGTVDLSTVGLLLSDFSLSVPDLTLEGGQNVSVSINAVDQFGDSITLSSSTWNTTNSTVVAVSQLNATHAVVNGMRTGTATVTVTSAGITETAMFTVSPGSFSRIEVSAPTQTTLYYGELTTFFLRGLDAGGNYVAIPSASRSAISFTVVESASTVGGGVFSCLMIASCPLSTPPYPVNFEADLEPGMAVVRITYGSQVIDTNFTVVMPESAVTSVRISPSSPTVTSGSSTSFTLIGIDADGDESVFTADSWVASAMTGTGSINSNGSFTGSLPGLVKVTGILNEFSGSTTATVVVGQAHRVNVTGPSSVVAGNAAVFTAVLTDAAGNLLTSYNNQTPIFTWSTSSGTMHTNGTLVATTAGNVTVTSQLTQNPSVSGAFSLTVNPGEVYGLVVAESGSTLTAGSTYLLAAVLVDKYGNGISNTDATWTILNGTGQATLNNRLITPTKIGYVTVYAVSLTNSSLTASGVLTIEAGAPSVINVQPTNAMVRQGDSVAFTVEAFDAFGNKYAYTNSTWSVSDSSRASISSTGVLSTYEAGTVTVTATVPGSVISDSVTVTILEPLSNQGQVASQFSTSLPGVIVTGASDILRTSANTGSSGGLTGLFTLGEGGLDALLLAGLALLLVGFVAYFVSTRSRS